MSDHEYIEAFRSGDQRAITSFYSKYRGDFVRNIGAYFHALNSDLLVDVFQESVVRLWQNITSEKLTESTLTTSLAGYLFSVGKNVALEIFRKEGVIFTTPIDEDKGIADSQSIKGGDLWQESKQEAAVRKAVYEMGEPCAPLLLKFYWDRSSWESIAFDLDYKDANSAKSQKYKCMQKLKAQFL